jgi:hypothetical protein
LYNDRVHEETAVADSGGFTPWGDSIVVPTGEVPPLPRPSLLLTIHDEVFVECRREEEQALIPTLAAAMTCREFNLEVPSEVSYTVTSWADKASAAKHLEWFPSALKRANEEWVASHPKGYVPESIEKELSP